MSYTGCRKVNQFSLSLFEHGKAATPRTSIAEGGLNMSDKDFRIVNYCGECQYKKI